MTPDNGRAFKEHFVNKCTREMAGDKCSERWDARPACPGRVPTAIRPSRRCKSCIPSRRATLPLQTGKQMLNCFLCNFSSFPASSQQVQPCLGLVCPTWAQQSLRSCCAPHGWCWPLSVCPEVPRSFSQRILFKYPRQT